MLWRSGKNLSKEKQFAKSDKPSKRQGCVKSIKNVGNKQQLSKHQISCQNIRHQKFLPKHQKWQLLSSRCILNMKRLVILKYKQRKTSKASSENNLEVRRQPH